jgi:hypothetical protein
MTLPAFNFLYTLLELAPTRNRQDGHHSCMGRIVPMDPLFAPFRALGYITDNVPFAIQRRGRESFVTVSVGSTWQVSPSLRGPLPCKPMQAQLWYAFALP